MKRTLSTLTILLLLFVAYQFSQFRMAPTIDLEQKQFTELKKQQEDVALPIQIADVKWPSEQKKKTVPKQKAHKNMKPHKIVHTEISTPKPSQSNKVATAGNTEGFDIIGQFDCSVEFYLNTMRRQGALTVVYENQSKKFYALSSDRSLTIIDQFPAGYSALARQLTEDYPGASTIISSATARWGSGHYDILLLLPQSMEKKLGQSLTRILASRVTPETVSTVYVQYRQSGTELLMHIDRIHVGDRQLVVNQTIRI
ncbi:MAG: hypothetical protein DRP47_10170 [Candidatus Zixiibacteriota bacterium]|nr:MAG: hypothetical protein DRP47_10170 [candidate division Zixibacteria bacterium]